jgi:hypothetical protein
MNSSRRIRTVTDAQGRYRVEFVFYLFFYDLTGFDRVKYRQPVPLTSATVSNQTTLVVNHILQFHPSGRVDA